MFVWLRKDEEVVKKKVGVEEDKDVYCATCGVRILRWKAKKVEVRNFMETVKFYCSVHAPAYDTEIVSQSSLSKIIYLKEISVDKNGNPIGYEKRKPIDSTSGTTISSSEQGSYTGGGVK